MTTFWLAILSLLTIALFIVWRIFASPKNSIGAKSDNIRHETNVSLYHEHLKSLENDLAEGSITQESFEQLKSELDKTLLQDVNANQQTTVVEDRASLFWPLAIAVAIVAISFYTYTVTGAYQALFAPAKLEQNAHGELTPEQMLEVELQKLEKLIQEDPTNSQARFSLGQAYIAGGLFDEAIAAFDKVMEQVGEHAELLGPKAQAMYYKNNQVISTDIQQVIDKALALDPLDSATNILLGMDNFTHQKFDKAVEYWERVLNSGRPGISVQALTGAVNEAKNQLRISQEMSSDGSTDKQSVDANMASISVDVSLSDSVIDVLMNQEDKTVFVYAIAASGPRMPLAAVKINASDLPLKVVLDDTQAMTPQMRLSDVENVHVYAVLSMQGGVGMKPGDYKAELLNLNIAQKDTVQLEINTKVIE